MAKKKRQKLSKEQKEQIAQKKDIRTILGRIGFHRIPGVDGKNFTYDGRQAELDDIFLLENVFLIVEYTVGEHYQSHLAKKSLLYNKIMSDPGSFIDYLVKEPCFDGLRSYYETNIRPQYPNYSQIQLRIVYCSKAEVSQEYRESLDQIKYFDLYVAHYFKYLSASLKMSAINEFLDFLGIQQSNYGVNIGSSQTRSLKFEAHVLPEVKSFFREGYKIVTFYMDPQSVLNRAYVLRHEGWRDKSSSVYYQRMADPKRITEIRKYLAQEKRVFVNNIIVTMSANDVTFMDRSDNVIDVSNDGKFLKNDNEVKTGIIKLSIVEKPNCIGIIDGQHRVFAYHVGEDVYEDIISKLRIEQNLLVTGIVFPKNEQEEERRKYEATLFREINVKQTKISSYLQQELAVMVEPFSLISIGKEIVSRLTENGPLSGKLERFSFEKGKVKTASVVSFGLRPLIKMGEDKDSLYCVWKDEDKERLLTAHKDKNYCLKNKYVDFCVESIRNLFIGVKNNIPSEEWKLYSPSEKKGLLSITFINGFLNLLRCIILNDGVLYSPEEYSERLRGLASFDFRSYKTSHYRKMGEDLFNRVFNKHYSS
ncbi:MAG: DGQHR domain-containing protein [Bacteroidales bacterium]|nr:DGQHR domain-containing protein [Bacteroidales bacterium]